MKICSCCHKRFDGSSWRMSVTFDGVPSVIMACSVKCMANLSKEINDNGLKNAVMVSKDQMNKSLRSLDN